MAGTDRQRFHVHERVCGFACGWGQGVQETLVFRILEPREKSKGLESEGFGKAPLW